eukprot:TRINITY_DN29726_c0_g1_i4.p1 TRINITY_DN29726_c0_g1~~TRINITY_DN29726_c0_g1_i4.p1  ORF type:complete len:687 (+),score=150.07 TRINITY_DN29726_c0_g1_i4:90-2150(+)
MQGRPMLRRLLASGAGAGAAVWLASQHAWATDTPVEYTDWNRLSHSRIREIHFARQARARLMVSDVDLDAIAEALRTLMDLPRFTEEEEFRVFRFAVKRCIEILSVALPTDELLLSDSARQELALALGSMRAGGAAVEDAEAEQEHAMRLRKYLADHAELPFLRLDLERRVHSCLAAIIARSQYRQIAVRRLCDPDDPEGKALLTDTVLAGVMGKFVDPDLRDELTEELSGLIKDIPFVPGSVIQFGINRVITTAGSYMQRALSNAMDAVQGMQDAADADAEAAGAAGAADVEAEPARFSMALQRCLVECVVEDSWVRSRILDSWRRKFYDPVAKIILDQIDTAALDHAVSVLHPSASLVTKVERIFKHFSGGEDVWDFDAVQRARAELQGIGYSVGNQCLCLREEEVRRLYAGCSPQAADVDYKRVLRKERKIAEGFPLAALGPFQLLTVPRCSALLAVEGDQWTCRLPGSHISGRLSKGCSLKTPEEQREDAGIPDGAAAMHFMYPSGPSVPPDFMNGVEVEETVKDGMRELLTYGGFLYTAADGSIAGARALRFPGKDLRFVGPLRLSAEEVKLLERNSSFVPVTLPVLRHRGARHFCWLPPRDNVGGKHGAFAYLFREPRAHDDAAEDPAEAPLPPTAGNATATAATSGGAPTKIEGIYFPLSRAGKGEHADALSPSKLRLY